MRNVCQPTIEITTPSLEELAIEPMEIDLLEPDDNFIVLPTTEEAETTTTILTTTETIKDRLDTGTLRPGFLDDDEDVARNVTEMPKITDILSGGSGGFDNFEDESCHANVCRNGGTCLSTLNSRRV